MRQSLVNLTTLGLSLALALAPACGGDDEALVDATSGADAQVADATAGDADLRPKLSDEGLYQDIKTFTVAPGAIEYTPAMALWSDGLVKRRWILLPGAPPAVKVDTADMDHWRFPVGTKLFKEFATAAGRRLETRVIERVDAADDVGSYRACAYLWNEEQTEARCVIGGAANVLGTTHDLPNAGRCTTCHKGEPGYVLGFSALQLSQPQEPNLKTLAAEGWLSAPPPPNTDYPFPGTGAEREALGYFHANCGHCHSEQGTGYMDTCKDNGMGQLSGCQVMRLSVADSGKPVGQSALYQSIVGVNTQYYPGGSGGVPRIKPKDPAGSAIFLRMNMRGSTDQMPPPFATEAKDDSALAAVMTWINGL
jgi:hypothetical protein